jgi:threonine dehydrogenase-like Zn-dependent dehydrogenase
MKAFRILAPGRTEVIELPKPIPREGEVLLRVRKVGFCGSDLSTFRGLNPLVQYPRIPGHEVSGIIEACGAGVPDEWTAGLQVTLSPYTSCGICSACRHGRFNCCRDNQTLGVQREGALAEYLGVPWQKLFRSPKLCLRDLALVEPLTVGFHAVDRGRVSASDTVLILGCGAIGLGAIAGAAFRKARVIAADLDDAKLAIARRCGAAETIHSKTEPLRERLRALTSGHGPDVVIEAVGMPQTFRAAVEEACFAGRVVYIGYVKAPVEYETRLFVQKELDIMGSRNAAPADFEAVIRLLETGGFPVECVVTHACTLETAGDALKDWDRNPGLVTKIVVSLD